MSVEDDTDRTNMLADFGVAATYNGATAITVIFDDEYLEDSPGQGPGADSSHPAALARASDVSNAVHGTPLVIGGTTYHVISIQPDGTGWTRLILEKQ